LNRSDMYKAAIFDWDGTLADTRKVIVLSFQKALEESNLSVSDEYIERRIGIGTAETFREILQSAKRQINEGLVERLVERKSQLEIELTSQIKLFPGARSLLEALHGKLKVGLASMNNRSVIMHLVEANNLTKYFETILTAESISLSKPNPEIFLKTAEKLKTNPEQCVVLEDSIFGVRAAKSGGMGCIAVTTRVYSRAELEREKADLVIDTLADERVLCFILE
jgi:beta-phosphoglucomutase